MKLKDTIAGSNDIGESFEEILKILQDMFLVYMPDFPASNDNNTDRK